MRPRRSSAARCCAAGRRTAWLRCCAPAAASLPSGACTSIAITSSPASVRRWGREFQRVTMALRQGADGPVGEAELSLAGMSPGMALDYFVIVKSDDGEEFVSEMRTVKVTP